MNQKGDVLAKILILGNSQVGKSSIMSQFIDGMFNETIPPTLGIDYKIHKMIAGGTEIKLQIWDTAGQERFKSITENFYKGAHGIILAFDLTDQESFSAIRNWLKSIYEKAGRNVVVCLCGNKLDLVTKAQNDITFNIRRDRFVRQSDIEDILQEVPIKYLQSSAKENLNIREAFQYLADELVQRNFNGELGTGDKIGKKGKSNNSSGGCCK